MYWTRLRHDRQYAGHVWTFLHEWRYRNGHYSHGYTLLSVLWMLVASTVAL